MSVFGSVLYGLANLLHPRMLWLMIWPMLVAVALWGTLAAVLWVRAAAWLSGVLRQWIDTASFLSSFNLGDATLIAAHVLLFLAFVPLVYLTALFILGLFGMQAMVDHVARRAYPELERRRGGGVAGTGWNGVVAVLGMLLIAIATLPLWLIPPLWPLIPVTILGWANQRLLRYDALAEHADGEEMPQVFRARRGGLYLLGGLMALVAYVPFLGFLAPVWFGLAFIHYLLGALEARRAIAAPYPADPNKALAGGNTPS
jgi:CysZ protein